MLPNKGVLVNPVFTCNYIVYNAKNITVCDSCIYLLKLTAIPYDIYVRGYILVIVIDNTCSIYLKLCIGNLGASIVKKIKEMWNKIDKWIILINE